MDWKLIIVLLIAVALTANAFLTEGFWSAMVVIGFMMLGLTIGVLLVTGGDN